jgi:hypothetical protein
MLEVVEDEQHAARAQDVDHRVQRIATCVQPHTQVLRQPTGDLADDGHVLQ